MSLASAQLSIIARVLFPTNSQPLAPTYIPTFRSNTSSDKASLRWTGKANTVLNFIIKI